MRLQYLNHDFKKQITIRMFRTTFQNFVNHMFNYFNWKENYDKNKVTGIYNRNM